jgi:TonB family protein
MTCFLSFVLADSHDQQKETGDTEKKGRDADLMDTESYDAEDAGVEEEEALLGDASNPPEMVPPILRTYVEAVYPEAASRSGLSGVVIALIDVSHVGEVTAVEVIETAGHGFDEAAVRAMREFQFEPAKKNGEPVNARVTYRYHFHPVKSAEEEAHGTCSFFGVVLDQSDTPISSASLSFERERRTHASSHEPTKSINSTFGKSVSFQADDAGYFHSPDLLPGAFRVTIASVGLRPLVIEERCAAHETIEVTYRLLPEASAYETVVRATKPQHEVTRRVLNYEEISRIPGTKGDTLRSIQNLPGMNLGSAASNQLLVRGSSPEDSTYYFNGISLPALYHFEEFTSVLNTDVIDRIAFYPGNFSVRYGRAIGGVIEVIPRAPKTDRFHGYIDVDFLDAGFLFEGPLSDNWSIAVSGRRSYIDAFLKNIDFLGDGMSIAPRYYDFQVLADYHNGYKDHLQLQFLVSDDRAIMEWGADDLFWGSGYEFHFGFYQLQASWSHTFDRVIKNRLDLGGGFVLTNEEDGNMTMKSHDFPLLVREELEVDPGRYLRLRIGAEADIRWSKYNYKVPPEYGGEGEFEEDVSAQNDWLTYRGSTARFWPALYSELEMTAIPKTSVTYGVRGDYFSEIGKWNVDPRVSARYSPVDGTFLKSALGLFSKPPQVHESHKDYGNPELLPTLALHVSFGLEQILLKHWELGLEGFFKNIYRIVRMSDDVIERDSETLPKRYDNDGTGRIWGMESLIKYHLPNRFFGWVAYTLMRSERVDAPKEKPRPFDYDQTHILTLVASVTIGLGWSAGLRFRLVSGTPDTPIIDANYNSDSDEYIPIYAKRNSIRTPMFHQLDIRIDKRWQWRYLALTCYVDVQNAYNQQNVEFYEYKYDGSKRYPITRGTILPSGGIKLEY